MLPQNDWRVRKFLCVSSMVLMTFLGFLVGGCGTKSSIDDIRTHRDRPNWQSMLEQTGVKHVDQAVLTGSRPLGSVGMNACIECHQSQSRSYSATSHSRSLRRCDMGSMNERSVEFEHKRSRRSYEVQVAAGKMVHRELIRDQQGETIAVNEAEIAIEIGSGEHAHSYLFERDGFFVQSPLTWYSAIEQWDLSPGFDPLTQATFDRTVNTNCIFCHAGAIKTQGNNIERFVISELAIGCERCHGPGGNHVAVHTGSPEQKKTGMVDDIVNPSRLNRSQADAICAQCHLQGAVSSSTYGVSRWDFRPGEPIARDTTEYQIQGQAAEFRIVGHTEQMYQSGCYLNTETLTCTTCHDPHEHANKNAASISQREICISCHQRDACGVPIDIRQTTQQNDCAVCHMPRRATNVQHAALHDHRIAVHEQSFLLAQLAVPKKLAKSFNSSNAQSKLTAIVEDAELPAWQRDRRWALAMHSLAFSNQIPNEMQGDLMQSQQKLLELFRGGHGDPNLNVSLAKDYLAASQFSSAGDLAKRALEASNAGDLAYVGAADVLAQLALRAEDNKTALHWYQQLTRYRRVSGDHVLLAVCENNAGNLDKAVRALETALEIDTTLVFAHELMVSVLDSLGQQDRADAHREALVSIRKAAPWLPQ